MITRGLGDMPLHLVLDLVVAGIRLAISAAELERRILDGADARRSGGTWQLHVATPVELTGRDASYVDGDWRWSADGEPVDATVVAKGGFMRALFDADRTPVGVERRSAQRRLLALRRRRAGHQPRPADRGSRRHVERPASAQYSSLRWRL